MPYLKWILEGRGRAGGWDLEEMASPARNVHLLEIRKLVARSVRERGCLWIVKEVHPKYQKDSKDKELNQEELERDLYMLMEHILEMIISSEFAKEELNQVLIIKNALILFHPMLLLLLDKTKKQLIENLITQTWEIYNAIANHEEEPKTMDNPSTYLLWGQSILRYGLGCFVPQGAKSIGKTEYNELLSLALRKFNLGLNLHSETAKPAQVKGYLEANIGYTHLLKAKATHDETRSRSLLIEAKKAFNASEHHFPSVNSTYNLACVCSLLGQDDEIKGWLSYCVRDNTLPDIAYVEKDTDFQYVRKSPWFINYITNVKINRGSLQSSALFDTPPSGDYVLSQHTSTPPHLEQSHSTTNTSHPPTTQDTTGAIIYTDDPELNTAITYDEELNRLQASLIREGFSMNTIIGMVLEVGKAKKNMELNNAKNELNRQRLNERMEILGLKEKRVIPGDGNCQFASVSDQLFDTLEHANLVRRRAIDWLIKNKNWRLPNGAVLSDFAHDQSWDEFCGELGRNGIWGNHLTLVAIAEYFGSKIYVISSVDGEYLINISPTITKSQKLILLSHYAEYHYGSLAINK